MDDFLPRSDATVTETWFDGWPRLMTTAIFACGLVSGPCCMHVIALAPISPSFFLYQHRLLQQGSGSRPRPSGIFREYRRGLNPVSRPACDELPLRRCGWPVAGTPSGVGVASRCYSKCITPTKLGFVSDAARGRLI